MNKRIFAGLILIMILAACGQETPTLAPTISPTTEVTAFHTSTFTPSPLPPTATLTTTPTGTSTSVPTDTPTPVLYGPNNYPADINPLTGLAVSNAALLNRRPLAFKINIVPRTYYRPAWGLSLADIVYDYYHNAGYNRFHAIFYGNDADLVGPIRSGRLLDSELIRMYQSIFAYGSADQLINARLLNSEYSYRVFLEGQQVNCPPSASTPMCRWEPATYDYLLSSTQALSEYAAAHGVDNNRQNLEGMTFFAPVPEGGSTANQIFARYSTDYYVRWDYDANSGRYLRFQDKAQDTGQGEEYEPLTDRLNDQQIAADNVVVIFVRHEYYQQPPNEIIDILLSGQGKAYAFRNGQVYEVNWNRPGLNTPLFLTYPDGTAFPYKPGTTWYQVVGTSTTVEQPSDGIWRFSFKMP
jgi:hypothetical protein